MQFYINLKSVHITTSHLSYICQAFNYVSFNHIFIKSASTKCCQVKGSRAHKCYAREIRVVAIRCYQVICHLALQMVLIMKYRMVCFPSYFVTAAGFSELWSVSVECLLNMSLLLSEHLITLELFLGQVWTLNLPRSLSLVCTLR